MIILADHNEQRRKILAPLIGEMGISVTLVSTARDLIWHLKNTKIRMLVLNPEMPDFGSRAFDLVNKVRSRYSKQEMPILLMTLMDPVHICKAFECGANDVMMLPLDVDLAKARLTHHMAMKKEWDDMRAQYARNQEIQNMYATGELERTVSLDPDRLRAEVGAPAEVAVLQDSLDFPIEELENATHDTLPQGAGVVVSEDISAGDATMTFPDDEMEKTVMVDKDELLNTQMVKLDTLSASVKNMDQIPVDKTIRVDTGTNSEKLFGMDTDPDKHVPCELPVNLELENRATFCKTIWLARRDLLLLCFEDLPEVTNAGIQMYDTQGVKVVLQGRETRREPVRDGAEGVCKVHMELTDVSENYESLFFLLRRAYQEKGLRGLYSVFPGGSAPEEHYARNLGSTMAFSASELSLNLMKGFRYKFVKRLGRGSFAAVYLVRDMVLKREVAMKVLNQNFSRESQARMNFLSEAQIAAQFHHPNIVFVYEVGEIRNGDYEKHLSFPDEVLQEYPERFIYFTMQFVEGDNLRNILAEDTTPGVDRLLTLIGQVGDALAYAHGKGVVHRDIKPENIMVTPEGRALVADFGIATLTLEDKAGEGHLRTACTPRYASPEQLEGFPLDKRSDIYSLGMVAYEILAGYGPFTGRTVNEVIFKSLQNEPEVIGKAPDLERIIYKCLRKKPEDRYDTVDDLLEELKAFKGARSDSPEAPNSLKQDLSNLVNDVIVAGDVKQSGTALEKVTSFLGLHKTDDDVEQIKVIKQRLSEPSLVNLVLEKNLNYDNLQVLIRFFTELSTTRVVATLLQWFTREPDARRKQWLGELALISVGRDLMLLVDYGLELPDHDACILLKCFGKLMPVTRETVYLRWSLHGGYLTQMELLKIVKQVEGHETEILNLLNLYANGNGTRHHKVRDLAGVLLDGRLLSIQ